jgi:DNA-binding IclR family transcriptional regulator
MAEGVASVSRALQVLEALAGGRRGLVDIARATGLSPSTVHRLLATLAARGYVRRDDDGRYLMGHRPLLLADAADDAAQLLRGVLRPFLARVGKVSGQTTNLMVLSGRDVLCLDHVVTAGTGSEPSVRRGAQLPAPATAAGRAILAFSTREAVAGACGPGPMPAYTDRSIVEPRRFSRELRAGRRNGFTVVREEWSPGLACVAAPVFGLGGSVMGALSIAATPESLHDLGEDAEIGELVGTSAIEASGVLGYDGASRWHA